MEWPSQDTFVIWITNVVIASFLLMTTIGICRFIRRQFKARVNCWFCNKNTWVPYVDRNQFTCPQCEQYNGFKDDGDYNKDLRAQYSPKYNKPPVARISNGSSVGSTVHGHHQQQLCETCSRNQELKVHQLACFVATDERNYDEEVELYREHLEETYRLCPGCERLVKRRLNQAKTLILGLKRPMLHRMNAGKGNGKEQSLLARIKRIVRLSLIFVVIVLLMQFFIRPRMLILITEAFVNHTFDVSTLMTSWNNISSGLLIADNMGYRLALMVTILVLLSKGEPMNSSEYVSISTLCSLHFLIGEKLLESWSMYPMVRDYMTPIEWGLRVVGLLASLAMFVDTWRRSPESSIKLNDSFHRIEVEDEDQLDSSNLSDSRSQFDTSTDFGSVFEYPQSLTSNRSSLRNRFPTSDAAAEDEEIRSISMNSSNNRTFHNVSDPVVQWSQQQRFSSDMTSFARKQNPEDNMSSNQSSHWIKPGVSNANNNKMLFPDDRFSNSIKSMRIGGEYHQIGSSASVTPSMMMHSPALNPFMKNMPLSASNSHISVTSGSNQTIYGSSRSLLTPSRLSLACSGSGYGNSAFMDAKGSSSWMTMTSPGSGSGTGSGFWNNHYPNVFQARSPSVNATSASFAYARPKSVVAAQSLDHGLNSERFVPLTESRSSSQSSGFESIRPATSSCQIPTTFTPIGGGGGLSPGLESASVYSGGSRWTTRGDRGDGLHREQVRDQVGNRTTSDSMGMGAFFQPNVFPRL